MEMKIRDYPDNRNIHDVQQELDAARATVYLQGVQAVPSERRETDGRTDGRPTSRPRRGRDSARTKFRGGRRVRESAAERFAARFQFARGRARQTDR
jgi:hypothetical protein